MKQSTPHITSAFLQVDESLLLQQVAKGSEEAFCRLYKIYQPKISRFLLPFTTIEDPKEIVQDIFLKVWEKREVLITIRSFEQYLYRMAKNRLIDLQKCNKARRQREIFVQRTGNRIEDPAFSHAEYKEVYGYALSVIRELTERQQLIFHLRMFDDKTPEEISRILSVSKAVVTKQLYLATRFIRERLKNYHHLEISLIIGLALFRSQLLS